MEEKIKGIFSALSPAFSRKATFSWFVIAVIGVILRNDSYGASSIVRALAMDGASYLCLLNFFHSSAWCKDRLLLLWTRFLLDGDIGYEVNGRIVLLADHTKQPKDGRKMPAVTTMKQDSETSSKPSYFRGHHWGFIALAAQKCSRFRAIPVWAEIHRDSGEDSRSVRMVKKTIEISEDVGKLFYVILDAFFSVGPVMSTAIGSCGRIHVLARAKKNVTAYEVPRAKRKKTRGKPRKYGKKHRLAKFFDRRKRRFSKAEARVYQKTETVSFMTVDMIWKPVKTVIRFFLIETSRGRIILMSSDLSMTALDALALYCARARIETSFDVFKNLLGGMAYHFWSKYLHPSSRRPSKNSVEQTSSNPGKTSNTLQAIEKFVAVCVIAQGMLQYISLCFATEIIKSNPCWLRTLPEKVPSEFVTRHSLISLFRRLLCTSAKDWITSLIREKKSRSVDLNSKETIFRKASGF